MECKEEKKSVNLFEYYRLQMGFKPPDGVATGFKAISINSPKGKFCKKTIDAAVALMESMNTQNFDSEVADIVLEYLVVFAFEAEKEKKVK